MINISDVSFDGNGNYQLTDGANIWTGTYEMTAEGMLETSEGDMIIMSPDGEVLTIVGPQDSAARIAVGIRKK